ncbi:hypothetical protein [Quadrisphaera setariae]|uniref:Uncharacterized protein n=1 Tax=Quadrisphaera setariae TaxID=2593304 RepID=A0A5C8ZDI2_9ACTN|nr:hypothetical protein [Quadrisphaera setariae]TXR55544.1 hypothetical protein FMM08_14710 [Quadrisphaera setariae]
MVGPRDGVEELDVDLDADLDEADQPEPPGPRPVVPRRASARRRRRRLLAAGVAVVVLLAAGVARQAWVRQEQGPPLDGSATAAELFPVLETGQAAGAGDGFPEQQARAGLGVVPGTAHLVAATTDLLFWVAEDSGGGVCLVVRPPGQPVRLGGKCVSTTEAATRGVALPDGDGVAATLVPDGLDTDGLARQGYVRLAAGLWVDERTAQRVASDAVASVTARPVVPVQTGTTDGRLPVFLTQDGATYAVVLACVGAPDAGGLAADPTAALAVDGDAERLDCSTTPAFRRFTGDGGPVRVDVDAPGPPGTVRWAARVVECEGSLRGPVCDRGGF